MKSAGIFIAVLILTVAGCGTDNKREAQYELKRAAVALQQGSLQAAGNHLDASLSKQPSAQAYQLRALTHLDPSRFHLALKDADAALKLDPGNRQLMELRDLAAAHLKLAKGQASVVENRRPSLHDPLGQNVAHIELLSFDSTAQQRKALRDAIEQNPFWTKRSALDREAYLQEVFETSEAFRPLVVSYEQVQCITDKAKELANYEESDLDLFVTFAHLSPLSKTGQELDDVSRVGILLLSREYRAAILQGF